MEGITLTYAVALSIGFFHAFEIDHLVAVGNLVSRKNSSRHAIYEGLRWGLGHTSSIFLIGLLIIVGKTMIAASSFELLEGIVGIMLIALGLYRLYELVKSYKHGLDHHHAKTFAYGVGLIHGLAGSGSLVLLVLSQTKSTITGMSFLLLFGIGSIVGMAVASSIFSLPFSTTFRKMKLIQMALSITSATLCIYIGGNLLTTHLLS
jgi:high-affinity nickel permease